MSDNSLLLHLRTGIDIVRTGRIPHQDPYSFTAFGHPWVLQSWLAEVSYGLAHAVGGYPAVRLEQGVLMGAVSLVVIVLARAGTGWRTLLAGGAALLAGLPLWSQRPLLFGLLGMALTILVVERRRSPWWLIPLVWVWANTHGSFPYGLAWLAAVYLGAAIDARQRPRWLEPYVGTFVAGLVVACVNPFGPRLIAFPLVVQQKHQVFQNIIEWKSPNFQATAPLVCLVFFCVCLVAVVRRGAGWRDALPCVGFLAAGLISERNLAVAAIVLAPAVGRALQRRPATPPLPVGESGPALPVSEPREPIPAPVLALGLGIAGLAVTVLALQQPALDLHSYPIGALRYLKSQHALTERIAAPDVVGDYRAFAEPAGGRVFIDDRYDMYPAAVVDDSLAIIAGHRAALDAIDKWKIAAVVWHKDEGPTSVLELAGGWRQAWTDGTWVVLVRDPAAPPLRGTASSRSS